MKTPSLSILLFAAFISITTACTRNTAKNGSTTSSNNKDLQDPKIVFIEEKHDFGTIDQGEKVSHSFIFENAGNSDLLISSATGSCGCTVPTFPEEPIKPGEKSKIDVVFDSEGKSGHVEKTITLVTNCKKSFKTLRISANIIAPE